MKGIRYKSYGMRGKKHNESTRLKMRESAKHRPKQSIETRKKRSNTMKGKPKSPEHIRKMIETKRNNPRYGEELWNINNGRTLCKKCHEQTPTYRNKNIYE